MPVDSGLTQKLNDVVGSLLTDDPDQDVTHAAHAVIERINSGTSFLSNGSLQGLSTVDCTDREREEEEKGVLTGDGEDDDSGTRDSAGGNRKDIDDARHDLTRRLVGGKDSGKDRHLAYKLVPKKVSGATHKPRSGPQMPSGVQSGVGAKLAVPSSLAAAPQKGRERHGSTGGATSPSSSANSLTPASLSLQSCRPRGRSAGTPQAPGQQRSLKSPAEATSSGGGGGGGGPSSTGGAAKPAARWSTPTSPAAGSAVPGLSFVPSAALRRKSDTPARGPTRAVPPLTASTSPRSSENKLHAASAATNASPVSPIPRLRNAAKALPPL
ncbi:MAG: hypothetical protein BJ554DRAFT_542 [Olpidium bornovanus]|uniref:Uncharacterized protein n=1 Tax=Olpidium bornovanus TaxID=278681 RepID=A0A8H7ZTE2_9FUNG|nr:MAG: hypothetical protein BJ554DRAFT_542 [Olpidium bornovanus]